MSYSQKYTIVQFIDPVLDATRFDMDTWPPHATIADVFAVQLSDGLIERLSELLKSTPSFFVKIGDKARLGATDVILVENNHDLQDLHEKVIAFLINNGAVFNMPAFTNQGFLPHVTTRVDDQVRTGDNVSIDGLSIVDMFDQQDWTKRRVLKTLPLLKS